MSHSLGSAKKKMQISRHRGGNVVQRTLFGGNGKNSMTGVKIFPVFPQRKKAGQMNEEKRIGNFES